MGNSKLCYMIRTFLRITGILFSAFFFQGCNDNQPPSDIKTDSARNEVVYHIFQRSFYDSNGDLQGDLNGLRGKLDYLQELGITSVLMVPLYESIYYHNYFSPDFKKIDGEYGTLDDYLTLVKEMHKRGMKLYMDMETQYATEDHPWYKDSYKNPKSVYSDYILYQDSLNNKPETIVFNLTELKGYDGKVSKITTVNLNNKDVQKYNHDLFKFWVDPNNDGKFDDGVDGFRLDHMMDDLDYKGKLKNLFSTFWSPLLDSLKKINPALINVAEQANWGSFGIDYLQKGGVDRVFAFRLQMAIRTFDKEKIRSMADSTFDQTPAGKQQIVFIENHDIPRFSTAVDKNKDKMKIGAAFNLLIGGIPSIYYGQELGMAGASGFGKYGMTDANEIPVREAFEWYKADTGKGMALWYKNSGPWWDSTNVKPGDGVSLEEEKPDPNSLWNFYKKLLSLRKEHSVLVDGKYQFLENDNANVYSFIRHKGNKTILVVINLSGSKQKAKINTSKATVNLDNSKPANLVGEGKPLVSKGLIELDMDEYGINVFSIQ